MSAVLGIRSGPWLATRRGRYYVYDPRPEDIDIETIAHALSNLCRWSGHADYYSVAQHSVFVSEHVVPSFALAGLLHDASEAYLHDIPAPLKEDAAMARYREAEDAALSVIAGRFGVDSLYPDAVRVADLRARATEWRDILPPTMAGQWTPAERPYADRIVPCGPAEARRLFLDRFAALTGGNG